jgi:hypothetical protein
MRQVIKRSDGFFGISGQPDSVYYQTAEHAERIAANLDTADNETNVGPGQVGSDVDDDEPEPACATDGGDDAGDLVEPE